MLKNYFECCFGRSRQNLIPRNRFLAKFVFLISRDLKMRPKHTPKFLAENSFSTASTHSGLTTRAASQFHYIALKLGPAFAARKPRGASTDWLFDEFEVTRLPALVKPWLQRAIKAKEDEVVFSGHGLNPVAFSALRCLRAEPYGVGSIRI